MKFCKILFLSILFLFCIGGVCAVDPDNSTALDKKDVENKELNVKLDNQSNKIIN